MANLPIYAHRYLNVAMRVHTVGNLLSYLPCTHLSNYQILEFEFLGVEERDSKAQHAGMHSLAKSTEQRLW